MHTERLSIQGATARYEPLLKLASGGMATVYVGRLIGALGFQRMVAIKRPHRHLLDDPRFVQMLLDEATLASRLQHANVVSVQDVVSVDGSVYLVMDLVEGASLAELTATARELDDRIFPNVVLRVMLDTCAGLHAAHELTDDDGKPLGLVHRDVSPHNVLVGLDGVGRVSDFGIAKCVNAHGASTSTGTLKGKYPYMAPEYIRGLGVDRRADVFSLAAVVWEQLAERRLFVGDSPPATMLAVVQDRAPLLSEVRPGFTEAFDAPLARALSKEPEQRFPTTRAFGEALEHAARGISMMASATEVGNVVQRLVGPAIEERKQRIREILQERAPEGTERERTTEPLPQGGPSPGTMSSRVTYELPSSPSSPPPSSGTEALPPAANAQREADAPGAREAMLPEVVSSTSNRTELSAIATGSAGRSRKGGTWLIVGAALLIGSGATWALQRLKASEPSSSQLPTVDAAGPATSISSAPPFGVLAFAPDAAPDASASALDVPRSKDPPPVAPPRREPPPKRTDGAGPDAGAPTPANRQPPPNPYGAPSSG